jgi:predicted permease
MPLRLPVYADEKVYLAALALAVVSGLLFGLVPIRQVQKADPYQVIKAGPTGMASRRLALRDVLLVAQVAICALLVTSSMVAVRGLERSLTGRFGIEPRGAMLANVQLEMGGYRGDAVPAMQKRMLAAMESIPGVSAVALTTRVPLDPNYFIVNAFKDETTDLRPKNSAARPYMYQVSPGYFRAAETTLVAGREIDWHDDAKSPRVAVVNREFARRVFGEESTAIGRHFKLRDGVRVQVVGIAENGKYFTFTESPAPAMFLPLLQSQSTTISAIVRSGRDPLELSAAIRRQIRDLDRTLPSVIMTWQQDLEGGALFPARVASVALGIMGILGSGLAVTGIFGMAAYSVSKRLKELGIRMALGARSPQVLQASLGRAFKLLAVGSTAGVILGVLSARVLAYIVFQATPRDPVVLTGVAAAMVLLGGLAAFVPARRALSLDPARLLREE